MSTQTGDLRDEIASIQLQLKNCKTDEERSNACAALSDLVLSQAREYSGPVASKLATEIFKFVGELIHSSNSHDKISGISSIDALIASDAASDRVTIMFNLLCRGGMNSKDERVLTSASKTLGKLIQTYSHSIADLINAEIVRSLEWLSDAKSGHVLAALLVLYQIAANSSSNIHLHLSQLLDLIWLSLRDRELSIRLAAKALLHASLRLLDDRQSIEDKHAQQIKLLYDEAVKSIEQSSQKGDQLHGALLTLNELVHYPQYLPGGDGYQHLCNVVIKFWDTNNALLRNQITVLVPALAERSPEQFCQHHLTAVMKPLLPALVQRDTAERARAFLTVGKLALAVRGHMQDYVDEIFAAVRTSVSSKRKSVFKEALMCVSMLSTAGVSIQKYARELQQQIFSVGLSQELVDILTNLAQNIPELSADIQLRLMEVLSNTLTLQTNFVHSGTLSRKLDKSSSISDIEQERSRIVLAIQTIGSFNFDRELLVEFSNTLLPIYFAHQDAGIRKEACLACCMILSRLPNTIATSEILSRLLETGIADADEHVRLAVILNISTSCDALLAHPDKIGMLALGLYDESVEIQGHVARLLARIATRNPAYISLLLHKRLLELRDELSYNKSSAICERSARLIACLVGDTSVTENSTVDSLVHESDQMNSYHSVFNRLAFPYIESLVRALISRANDADSRVVVSILRAISALVCQAPLDLAADLVEELLKLIAEVLQDRSSTAKRVMALKCLAVIAQFTSPAMKAALHSSQVYEIVLEMLKADQLPAIRQLVTAVMGTFGAVDWQWHRRMQLEDLKSTHKIASHRIVLSNTGEGDVYASTVVDTLLRVIHDQSLSAHHRQALQALVFVFDSLGHQCAPLFRAVLDALLVLIHNGDSLLREITLQQLSGLMSVVKENIQEFLPEIMLLISEYWQAHPMQILLLIEVAALALKEGFAAFVPQITPCLVAFLQDSSFQRLVKVKALHTVASLGSLLTRQLYLVVPAIAALFTTSATNDISHEALVAVDTLAQQVDISRYASSIIHPLIRVLNARADRQDVAMQLLCSLLTQMREAFTVFVPSIRNVLTQNNVVHIAYNKLEGQLLRNELADSEDEDEDDQPLLASPGTDTRKYQSRLKANEQFLGKVWSTAPRVTAEEWHDWFRRFNVELLRESPSPSVRSCLVLSDYQPLVHELFNVAFHSCWTSLSSDSQDDLIRNLLIMFNSDTAPADVLQTYLDLAEFMDHNNTPLPIDSRVLIQLTERCRAYAKSLRYLEAEYVDLPTDTSTIELLIGAYNKLGLPDAANGILKQATQKFRLPVQVSWYERLGRWEKALEQLRDDRVSSEATLTRVRCLRALGEWQQLAQITQQELPRFDAATQLSVASIALSAAWALQDWEAMRQYVHILPATHFEGAFYRAVLHIHHNEFDEARQHITTARVLLGPEFKVLLSESYQRSYPILVRLQQLSEMTEVIDYKQHNDCEERQAALLNNWTERLRNCERDPDVWHQLLSVRSLAVNPLNDAAIWLKFAALCRKNERHQQAHAVLHSLLGHDLTVDASEDALAPQVSFAFAKLLWSENKRSLAFERLQRRAIDYQAGNNLQARMLVKLGQWQIAMQDGLREDNLSHVMRTVKAATELDSDYQQGWHAWAMLNFDAITHYENQLGKNKDAQAVADKIGVHLVPAIDSFFRAVSLRQGDALQDTLRLLTLWFKYGANQQAEAALREGFDMCPVETWLQVIPQLIARAHTPVETIRRLLHELICRLGREHPQALVFPLTVAKKSPSQQRFMAARDIIERLRGHHAKMLDQALLVSNELIRVGFLWPEVCANAIEEGGRLLFAQDIDGALEVLGQMHRNFMQPVTLSELTFVQEYGRQLEQALAWCQKYVNEGRKSHLNQAWSFYRHVHDQIKRNLFTTLELNHTSPQLFAAHDLDLAVPGSYKPHRPLVCIAKFQPQLQVFKTKQRPRKLTLLGSTGTQFNYLLKSREDLRLDERAMQLIRLVNTLLKGGHKTSKKRSINTNKNLSHLTIANYAVVPLSPDSGLIGWVPHSDTINQLIFEHRTANNRSVFTEGQFLMQRGNYDTLGEQEKYGVLRDVFSKTEPQDLAQILWSKSPNSEVWLERRTTFTRSLAVMSMVGYVLGLGDRHLSNVMLDRHTGQVIHIDFGDCFEVAMQRENFAETVPFRLTRMFVNAMEVRSVEGVFRTTSETVVNVLREHKESLMAVLEAFVHDPLINWRLIGSNGTASNDARDETFALEENNNERFSLETSPRHSYEKSKSWDEYMSALEDAARSPEQNNNNNVVVQADALNQRAVAAINRVSQKLSGRDFGEQALDVSQQVTQLTQQATSLHNLSAMFSGWCPYW